MVDGATDTGWAHVLELARVETTVAFCGAGRRSATHTLDPKRHPGGNSWG